MTPEETRKLIEAVRAACLKAAQEGYEQASVSGLCHEGAMEASLDAIRMLDIDALAHSVDEGKKPR